MIKEELEEVLRENEFDEELIKDILSKDIPFSIKRSEKVKLDRNIKLMESKNFSKEIIAEKISAVSKAGVEALDKNIDLLREIGMDDKEVLGHMSIIVDTKPLDLAKSLKVLLAHGIKKEVIAKNINSIVNAKSDNVSKLMYILKKYRISNSAIEKSIKAIFNQNAGKTEKYEEMLWFVNKKQIPQNIIEDNLGDFSSQDVDTLRKTFEVLEKNKIKPELINKYIKKVIKAVPDDLEETFEVLHNNSISSEVIEEVVLELMHDNRQGKRSVKLEELFETLKENNIEPKQIEKCVGLIKHNADRVREVFAVLHDKEDHGYTISDQAIQSTLSVLIASPEELRARLKALSKHKISNEAVERCLTSLLRSNPETIEKTIKVLEENNISKNEIEKCLSILTLKDLNDIEKVFKTLKENNINPRRVNNCLSALLGVREESLANNFEILKKYGLGAEAIERNLPILTKANPLNLNKMLEILTKNNIEKKSIGNALTVFRESSPEELHKIFEIFKENKINSDAINKYYTLKLFKNSDYVRDIFSKDPIYIKEYLKFKDKYNRFLSLEHIVQLSKEKGATVKEFLKQTDHPNTAEIAIETLKKKRKLYIGDYIPIPKEYMKQNAEKLIKLSERVAANYVKKSRYKDFDDIKDFTMDVLLTRCGNIVYNLDSNPEIMMYALHSNCNKYLYMYEQIKSLDILTDFQDPLNQRVYGKRDKEKEEIEFKDWNINEDEKTLLEMLSQTLEEGYGQIDAFEIAAQRLDMDTGAFLKKIERIKNNNEKMANQKMRVKTSGEAR